MRHTVFGGNATFGSNAAFVLILKNWEFLLPQNGLDASKTRLAQAKGEIDRLVIEVFA